MLQDEKNYRDGQEELQKKIVNILNTSEIYFKMAKIVNFVMCILTHTHKTEMN